MLSVSELASALALGLLAIVLYFQLQQKVYPSPPLRLPPPTHLHTSSPPIRIIKTPYNEDEIADIVTKIYEALVKLCYISAEDITWLSSTVGQVINEAICDELHLDSAVISLMKKLPYPKDVYTALRMDLFPFSRPYCYLDDTEIQAARDPENIMDDCRMNYLLPQDISLTVGLRDGHAVVLDTRENAVHVIDSMSRPPGNMSPPGMKFERPTEPDHYRNYFPQHAPTYLRQHLERIESLDLIPCRSTISDGFFGECDMEDVQLKMRMVLIEEYGWSENFRREDWQREMNDLWCKAIRESLY